MAGETLVRAAHRCVGWLQHPNETTRAPAAVTVDNLMPILPSAGTRNELFPGAGVVVDQLFSAIAVIALERARRQGLAIVHAKIENGVCQFPAPPGLAATVVPPLVPDTCALVRATDLLALIGQPRPLRAALVNDVTSLAALEFSARFNHLPAFDAPATAAFALVRRYASEQGFRPGRDNVRPIAEAFLNAPWATQNGSTFTPVLPITREMATLEVALSAARVLALLKSSFLLRELMLRMTMDTLLGDDVGARVPSPDPANMGAFANCAPARNPGVTASTAGTATHPDAASAAREDRPLPLGPAFAHLDRMAIGARHRQA
jgi:hypothetical protein